MYSDWLFSHALRLVVLTCTQTSCSDMYSDWLFSHILRLVVLTCSQTGCSHMYSDWLFPHLLRLVVSTCTQTGCSHMYSGLFSHVLRLVVLTFTQTGCSQMYSDWLFSHVLRLVVLTCSQTGCSLFQLCQSYPQSVFVPKTVTDEMLVRVAQFRQNGRFPVLSYYHRDSKVGNVWYNTLYFSMIRLYSTEAKRLLI